MKQWENKQIQEPQSICLAYSIAWAFQFIVCWTWRESSSQGEQKSPPPFFLGSSRGIKCGRLQGVDQGLEKPPKHTKAEIKGKGMVVRWCGVTQAQCGNDLSHLWKWQRMKCRDIACVQHSSPENTVQCFTPSQDFLMILIDGPHGKFLKTTDYQCKSIWLKFFMSDVDFFLSESRISHQREP